MLEQVEPHAAAQSAAVAHRGEAFGLDLRAAFPIAGIERFDADALPSVERDRLGEPVSADGRSSRHALGQLHGPRTLTSLYLLARGDGEGPLRFRAPGRGDPRPVLSAAFTLIVRDEHRLQRQLEMCARVTETVDVVWVEVPAAVDAPALAGAILEREGAAR